MGPQAVLSDQMVPLAGLCVQTGLQAVPKVGQDHRLGSTTWKPAGCAPLLDSCWPGFLVGWGLPLYPAAGWGWRPCSAVEWGDYPISLLDEAKGCTPQLGCVTGWASCLAEWYKGYKQMFQTMSKGHQTLLRREWLSSRLTCHILLPCLWQNFFANGSRHFVTQLKYAFHNPFITKQVEVVFSLLAQGN